MFVSNTPALDAKVLELRKAEKPAAPETRDKAPVTDKTTGVSGAAPGEATDKPRAGSAPLAASDNKDVKESPVTAKSVEKAIEDVREFVQRNQRSLDFQVAEQSNRVIITVIDRETNEVIRQIPPEDFVKMAEMMRNSTEGRSDGLLFRGTA